MTQVAFQGEKGAYSEEAIYQFFGPEVETLPCHRFENIFEAVESGTADYGALPVENSTAGSINQAYDLLLARDLRIPVVPVGLAGAGTALPSGQRWPRPGRLWVVFGAPLTVVTEEEQEPSRFTQRLEQEVRRLVSCAKKAKR